MSRLRGWARLRRVFLAAAPGVFLLQGACPMDVEGLLVRQATQVFTDAVFFFVESALVRAL